MTEYKLHRVKFIDYHPKAVNSVAFDTSATSPKCALAREDGTIEIRNPDTDWIVEKIIPGQDERTVEHLGWCNGRLFSGGLNGEIIEWNLENLQPKYREDSNGGPVWCFKFNHKNTLLAVGCEDGSIRMFEVLHDSIFYQNSLYKQEKRILSLAWSHDDVLLVTGGFDSTIRVYDVDTGKVISRMTTCNKKATIVWSVQMLKDMTVVTGDSFGKTQFWDGNTGTLLQSFQSHEADVLTLAVSDDGNTVYSSGIDSKIVKFYFVEVEDFNKWNKTVYHRPSQYDIRALTVCPNPRNYVVAAGVHPNFVVYNGNEKTSVPKTFKTFSYLPQRNVCYLAASSNRIMFREQRKLHIWELGNSELLFSSSQKICEIKCEDPNHILCSAISSSSEYIAYSTVKRAKIIKMSTKVPVQIKKVRIQLEPMSTMAFTEDSKFLLGTTFKKVFQLVDFENVDIVEIPILESENVSLPFQELVVSQKNHYFCLTDSSSNCFVFSFDNGEIEYKRKVPSLGSRITCCTFKPNSSKLILATANKKLYDFELAEEKLSIIEQNKKINKPVDIKFNPTKEDEMFIQSENNFCKIELTAREEMETPKKKQRLHANKTAEFDNLLFFGFTASGEIVIVEHSEATIVKNLPDPLEIKKFNDK